MVSFFLPQGAEKLMENVQRLARLPGKEYGEVSVAAAQVNAERQPTLQTN